MTKLYNSKNEVIFEDKAKTVEETFINLLKKKTAGKDKEVSNLCLKNLEFTKKQQAEINKKGLLTDKHFINVSFYKCNFSNMMLEKLRLEDCCFSVCNFDSTVIKNSSMTNKVYDEKKDILFHDTSFYATNFVGNTINGVTFDSNHFKFGVFGDNNIENCKFESNIYDFYNEENNIYHNCNININQFDELTNEFNKYYDCLFLKNTYLPSTCQCLIFENIFDKCTLTDNEFIFAIIGRNKYRECNIHEDKFTRGLFFQNIIDKCNLIDSIFNKLKISFCEINKSNFTGSSFSEVEFKKNKTFFNNFEKSFFIKTERPIDNIQPTDDTYHALTM